jgi:hypothetical protein
MQGENVQKIAGIAWESPFLPENIVKSVENVIKKGENEFLLNHFTFELRHGGLRQFLYYLRENDIKAYDHLKKTAESLYPDDNEYIDYLFNLSPKNFKFAYDELYDEKGWLKNAEEFPKINAEIFN